MFKKNSNCFPIETLSVLLSLLLLDPSYDAVRRTGWSNNMHSGKGESTQIINNCFSFSLNSNGRYEWSNLLSRGMIHDKPNHLLWGGS